MTHRSNPFQITFSTPSGREITVATLYSVLGKPVTENLTVQDIWSDEARSGLQQIQRSVTHMDLHDRNLLEFMVEKGPSYLDASVTYEPMVVEFNEANGTFLRSSYGDDFAFIFPVYVWVATRLLLLCRLLLLTLCITCTYTTPCVFASVPTHTYTQVPLVPMVARVCMPSTRQHPRHPQYPPTGTEPTGTSTRTASSTSHPGTKTPATPTCLRQPRCMSSGCRGPRHSARRRSTGIGRTTLKTFRMTCRIRKWWRRRVLIQSRTRATSLGCSFRCVGGGMCVENVEDLLVNVKGSAAPYCHCAATDSPTL